MQDIPRLNLSKDPNQTAESLPELSRCINAVHASCSFATPKHFSNFIQMYLKLFNTKQDVMHRQQNRLQAGLAKLQDAAGLVDELKEKARKQSQLVTQKQREADQALQEITDSMAKASKQKVEAEQVRELVTKEEAKLAQRKKAIDAELSTIEPILAAARSAVGQIKPESLSEIRALRAPPDTIRDILQGVLTLMGIFDTSWVSMRSFLAKRGVTDDIIHFDARHISPETRQNVDNFIKSHESSFDVNNAKRASQAAAPLAKWVVANLQYAAVTEKIEPLETENNKLKQNLVESQEK